MAQREKGTGMTIAFASHVTVNNCFCMCCVLSLCRKCGIHPGALCSPTESSSGPKTSMTTGRHSASKHLHSICHHDVRSLIAICCVFQPLARHPTTRLYPRKRGGQVARMQRQTRQRQAAWSFSAMETI